MDEAIDCLMCGGTGELLGTLGRLEHYRCRDCGSTFHFEPCDDEDEGDEDEE